MSTDKTTENQQATSQTIEEASQPAADFNDLTGGQSMGWDNLDEKFGDAEEAAPEPEDEARFLSKEQIADAAFAAMARIWNAVEDDTIPDFELLSNEDQEEYLDMALGALLMIHGGEKDDAKIADMLHSKRALRFMIKGWTFDENVDSTAMTTFIVAPWLTQPHPRRAPLLAFVGVCRGVAAIWDRDNEFLKNG